MHRACLPHGVVPACTNTGLQPMMNLMPPRPANPNAIIQNGPMMLPMSIRPLSPPALQNVVLVSPPSSPRLSSGNLHTHTTNTTRTYVDPSSYENPEELVKEFTSELNQDSVQIVNYIGGGAFGNVFRGTMDVAVKTLKQNATEKDHADFLKEAAIMGQFKHPNVIRLLGVVTETEPPLIVTELMENGSLETFLRQHRFHPDITTVKQSDMMKDIASGMRYLSEKGYVHRDLAARNILINKQLVCKVADFGLSRSKNEDGAYESEKGICPIRWTAPEAIADKIFTSASDVWSFGIVMWEIMSYGETPYNNLKNKDVIDHVSCGSPLPLPEECPSVIYDLMCECWQCAPYRPTFSEIVAKLHQIIEHFTEQRVLTSQLELES